MQPTVQPAYPEPMGPRAVALQLALGLLTAGLTSLLIGLLWSHLGLPDRPQGPGSLAQSAKPWGLMRFVSLAGPAAVFLPSLFLGALVLMLPRPAGPDQAAGQAALARWALKLDALTYLACPAFFLLPLIWDELGNSMAALGLMYLGLVAVKAVLLLRLLWGGFLRPAARAGEAPGTRGGLRRSLAVFLAAWVLLGLAAVWHEEAISSASDEVGYMLLTHSLLTRGDFDVFPAIEGREYESFYWARFSPGLRQDTTMAQAWLFLFLIAPAQFLAGRLGVLLMLAGLTALAATQLLAWLERAGLAPGPAAAAVGLTMASAPVFFLGQQVYPDAAAMLLLVVGMRLLLALPDRPWQCSLLLAAVAACLTGLKLRLMPLAGGLALAGAAEIMALRWGARRALAFTGLGLLALAGLVWLTPAGWWPRALADQWPLALEQLKRIQHWWDPIHIFFTGLAVDQNFGVLFVAPVFLLALAALPAGLRAMPRPMLHLLIPAGLYLGLLCMTRWFQWYAGFSPPGRFAALLLPLAALPLGLAVTCLRRPWLRLAVGLPAAWGLAYTWLCSLTPQLRFSRPVGVNPLAGAVSSALDLPLHHLLPSTFTLSPGLVPWLVSTGLAGLGLALYFLLACPAGRQTPAPSPPSPAEAMATALIAGLAGLGLLLTAWLNPPRHLEAEQMLTSDAAAWTEYAYPDFMRGMVLLDGQSLRGELRFPGGPARLRLVGRAERAGQTTLVVDGRRWELDWAARAQGAVADLGEVEPGRHRIELTWRSCSARSCYLLLDRIELAR